MSTLISRSFMLLSRHKEYVFSKVRRVHISKTLRQEKLIKPVEKRRLHFQGITWTSLILTSVLGSGFIYYLYYLQEKKDIQLEKQRRRNLGKAAIGGKFELVNSEGKLVKSDDFLGKWVLVYFGFTHCPDVCPDELEKLAALTDKLVNEYKMKVQPLFISVDPERDTPAIVGKYVKEFSDKIIGLTGSVEQVAKACRGYRVYYSNGPKDVDSDYIVDHTIIIYLIDPEGLFVDYYGQTHTVEQISNSIVLHKEKFDKVVGSS